jgi:hypothetical protein
MGHLPRLQGLSNPVRESQITLIRRQATAEKGPDEVCFGAPRNPKAYGLRITIFGVDGLSVNPRG